MVTADIPTEVLMVAISLGMAKGELAGIILLGEFRELLSQGFGG